MIAEAALVIACVALVVALGNVDWQARRWRKMFRNMDNP